MKFKSFLLPLLGTVGLATSANAATITGYNILNADPSGIAGWDHTYTGTISAAASGLAGVFDYTGGTGTLADGFVSSNSRNNQLFLSDNSARNASITLFFDQAYSFNQIEIFGADNYVNNNVPGNISGFDVTIGGVTATLSTIPFGPLTTNETPAQNMNDRALFAGTSLAGLVASSITLSNFQVTDSAGNFRFNIGEIIVAGDPSQVPVPTALPLFVAGLAGLGFAKKRKKSEAVKA